MRNLTMDVKNWFLPIRSTAGARSRYKHMKTMRITGSGVVEVDGAELLKSPDVQKQVAIARRIVSAQ